LNSFNVGSILWSIPHDYLKSAKALAEKQAALAGSRLAKKLNDIGEAIIL